MHVPPNALGVLFVACQILSLVYAHVEMKVPTPFRSRFLVPNGPNVDVNNNAPLNKDGSDFPCKLYHHDDLAPTTTLIAGQSFRLEYVSFRDTCTDLSQVGRFGNAWRRA